MSEAKYKNTVLSRLPQDAIQRLSISYTRGYIVILDFPDLQARSCECYLILKKHLDNYAGFDEDQTK